MRCFRWLLVWLAVATLSRASALTSLSIYGMSSSDKVLPGNWLITGLGPGFHLSFGSISSAMWTSNARPTIECPSLCPVMDFSNSVNDASPIYLVVMYNGVTYDAHAPAGQSIVAGFSMNLYSSVAAATFSEEPGPGHSILRTAAYGPVPFYMIGSVTLQDPSGSQTVIDLSAFGTAQGSAYHATNTDAGDLVAWQSTMQYNGGPLQPLDKPEPSSGSLVALVGVGLAVRFLARRDSARVHEAKK